MKFVDTRAEDYRDFFKRLATHGYTFDEVENRYFILYHNLNKVLSVEFNHLKKRTFIHCFDEKINNFLHYLIARDLPEDKIITNIITAHRLKIAVSKS
jgi:hypothetical protein